MDVASFLSECILYSDLLLFQKIVGYVGSLYGLYVFGSCMDLCLYICRSSTFCIRNVDEIVLPLAML